MIFNPEDGEQFGPHCRNCHKGSSRCSTCHNTSLAIPAGKTLPLLDGNVTTNEANAANNVYDNNPNFAGAQGNSTYTLASTSTGQVNSVDLQFTSAGDETSSNLAYIKKSRTVAWDSDWRTTETIANSDCSDDGLSWPHRTLGWKMLKDDLFGIDVGVASDLDKSDSEVVLAGAPRMGIYRVNDGLGNPVAAHDIDSVCLDCHNPTV